MKRKKVLIHSLQLKYSLYVAIAMLGIMFLTILNTYMDMISLINTVLAEKGRRYILFMDLITPLLLIKVFLICIVIILAGVLLSHRFAGPIYRFNKTFQMIKRGELSIAEVKLRPKDEFHDEAVELSSMIKNLKDIINQLKEDIHALSCEDKVISPEAKQIINRLKERVSFFKTE